MWKSQNVRVRCDLHVHSYFSGACTSPILNLFCRESYSQPNDVYERLQQRGMGLITLTDHDSIEGAELLRNHPGFFTSVELTCKMPSGNIAHIGVYDISERQHIELQRRREDLPALLAYLSERRLFFSINHVFSGLTGARNKSDFRWFREYFPAIESMNGHMLAEQNASAARLADVWCKTQIGGSDSHALPSVGSAYTEVPGARNKDEFFAGLRAGRGVARGESGSFAKLTIDVFVIIGELIREKKWLALASPIVVLAPLFTYWNYRGEAAFVRRWSREIPGSVEISTGKNWITGSQRKVSQQTFSQQSLPAIEEAM
jgi:predicted metal-dependent phosphoesterase TrpH